jgi:hypothetical protein
MQDILINIPESDKRRKTILFSMLVIAYVGLFALMASGGDSQTSTITQVDPNILLVTQGIISGVFFILLPLLFAQHALAFSSKNFFQPIPLKQLFYLLIIGVSLMVVLSVVIEWNMNIVLPGEAFHVWAKAKEAELKALTEHIIDFQSTTQFTIAFVVIAVFAAIGEEVLFRGLLQNLLAKLSGNIHVAIWGSAILFSAIHLQFFGFFPRMLLGALFGYLYHWSGRLSVAMFAHFFHNGLSITAAYVVSMELTSLPVSPEQMDKAAPWHLILLFALIGIFVLIRFKNHAQENEQLAERV